MYDAINLTNFPLAQFADADGRRPGETCLCVKARLRLASGGVPIEDTEIEQPPPSVGLDNADFGNSLVHDSDFVFPKPAVDVVLEADYVPQAEDQDAGVVPVTFEIAAPPANDEERILFRKTVDVHPERWWKIESGGEPQQRRVTLIRGGFTPFHLRAEFGHGGLSSRYNRKGIGFEPYTKEGTVPLCRLMPPGVERYRWDEDRPSTGFTAVEASDASRQRFYGTTDDRWRKYRAPAKPDDFDARYYSFAPRDQQVAHDFRGGEIFRFHGFGPAPRRFSFTFPGHRLQCYVKLTKIPATPEDVEAAARDPSWGTRVTLHRLKVDTILVDLTNRQIDISWRLALPPVDPAAWRVLLVIFDETQASEADAIVRDEDAVGEPPTEQAIIDNLMSLPEVEAMLGGRVPASLEQMNAMAMQAAQSQVNALLQQMRGLSAVPGRSVPSLAQIEAAAKGGGNIRTILGRLGMGDLL